MKKIVRFMILSAVAVFTLSCAQQKGDVVKIGVVSPMTGAGAACVEYWVNGFNMAIEQLNQENEGLKYEIIFEDCQSDPAKAVSCYKRLEMQGVKYVVGFGGQFAMAIAPLTKSKDMIYFTTADYNEAVLDITDCGFRVYPSARALGDIAAEYMVDTCGLSNLATITMNTVPCLQTNERFCANIAAKENAEVKFQDKYDIGTFDFKNTVNKMANLKCDGIFMTGFGNSPASFATQLGFVEGYNDAVMFGDVNLSTASFAQNNKTDKIDIYFADAKIAPEFMERYKAQFNDSANSYVSCAYLIPFIVDAARKGVENPSDYNAQKEFLRGATVTCDACEISFNEVGNGEMAMDVHKLQ